MCVHVQNNADTGKQDAHLFKLKSSTSYTLYVHLKGLKRMTFAEVKAHVEIHSSYSFSCSLVFHQVYCEREHHVLLFYGFL